MGWFSPVKGSYPSLAQVDKTLPVSNTEGNDAIKRGTILAVVAGSNGNSDGEFTIAKVGNESKMFYVSLQDYTDPAAGYAGTTFDPNGGTPAITGIDLAQDGEYETSEFDNSDGLKYAVGTELTAKLGKLCPASAGDPSLGYVTRGVAERWVNNAIALPSQKNGATDPRVAIRTGANLQVIRFKTAV